MASGVSLVSFNSRGMEGMHQRSYSVSSADQWTDATVIANSGVSTGNEHTLTGKNRIASYWLEGGVTFTSSSQ